MTILFFDSFHYDDADIPQKYPFCGNNMAGMTACTITNNGRRGANCMQTPNTSLWTARRMIPSNQTVCIGAAIQLNTALTTAGHLFTFGYQNNDHVHCYVNSSRQIEVRRGATTVLATSGATLSLGVRYFIEFKAKIDDSAGTYEVRVDGVAVVGPTGSADTRNTVTALVDEFALGARINQALQGLHCSGGIYINDLYVATDFLGDVRTDAILPSGAGNSTGLTASTGSNYACVDESQTNGDTDYVSSTSTGRDTYACANLSHSPTTIHAIQTSIGCRKDDSGSRLVNGVIRTGSTDYDGATATVGNRASESGAYGFISQVYETIPSGGAWSISNFNGAEFGAEVTT